MSGHPERNQSQSTASPDSAYPAGWSAEELCAAYLADPRRTPPAGLPWGLCDVERLLQVLRKNKVPLLPLAGHPQLQSDPLFQAACQGEAESLAGLLSEYKRAHEALLSHGIRGILIKSVGLEPSFPFKSDNLDVLYRPQDVEQIRNTLCQLGYVELRNVEEPHKYLFRKFHAGRSVSAIHVHAHVGWMTSFLDEERIWQSCRPASDEDWITILGPEDALLTTLAHWFYEDKRLVLQDVVKYGHCLRQGIDWDEIYRVATWRGWRDGLNVSLLLCSCQETALYGQTLVPLSILEGAWRGIPGWAQKVLARHPGARVPSALRPSSAGGPVPSAKTPGCSSDSGEGAMEYRHHPQRSVEQRVATPLRVPFLFSKAFSYAKLWRDPSRSAARRAKDLIVHTGYGVKLRLHIHSQPAMLVTFSGVDGCGKTTQARALQSAFETCLLRANYTWSRGGSASWYSVPRRVRDWIAFLNRGIRRLILHTAPTLPETQGGVPEARGGALGLVEQHRVEARQEQVRSPWKRWVWSWLTTGELLLQYTWRVTLPLLLGRVVICDRYVEDALADWSAYFREPAVEKRWAARVLRALTPHPDRAYWLDVSAEVAQSRSVDDLPAHFLDAQSALYRRLTEMGGPALRRLDGSQGWEEINDQVVYDVLSAYFAEYWTCINTLFWKNPGQWR